jgi:hypothetical protein
MYSEMMKTLGFNQGTLEMMVIAAVVVVVLGVIFMLFWKFIVIGLAITAGFMVLANHKPTELPKEEIISVVKQELPIIASPPVVEEKPKQDLMTSPKKDKDYFMEDCLALTNNTKKECENIWDNRLEDELNVQSANNVKLLDVSNREYIKKRAAALRKPNAVVGQATYH